MKICELRSLKHFQSDMMTGLGCAAGHHNVFYFVHKLCQDIKK